MKPQPSVEMVITELRRAGDGTLESTPSVFRFTGREHSSAQGEIQMNLKVSTVRREMPGSNTVVEQALAATWQPFEIVGEWDDKWGNRSPSGVAGLVGSGTGPYAMYMFTEFAEMVSRMPYVRFELDTLSFVGMLTDLVVTYRTSTRIVWKVTLSPHQNETLVDYSQKKLEKRQSIPKWLNDVANHRVKLNVNLAKAKAMSLKTPRISRFEDAMAQINDACDRLDKLGYDTFTSDTLKKLLLLATTFRRVSESCSNLVDTLDTITSADDVAWDGILETFKHLEWRADGLSVAWLMLGLSNEAAKDMQRRAEQKPKALYYPKAGEHLERISVKFYGTPDNWRQIYDRNHLSTIVMVGNEELIIPERAT